MGARSSLAVLLLVGCDPAGSQRAARATSAGGAARLETSTADKVIASDVADGSHFGYAASGAGDLNGDGYDDVIVGAIHDTDNGTEAGAAYVFYGTATGLDPAEDKLIASDGAASDQFGAWVAGAGDIDGDGYDDVVVGAPDDDSSAGAAYVYFGSAAGIQASTEHKVTASDGDDDDRFGVFVDSAGDIDADGYSDLVIGAEGVDDSGAGAGAAYVYYGSATGLQAREQKLLASDGAAGDAYGASVAGPGDIDGDGYGDVIVGAPLRGSDDAGALYIHYGSASGISSAAQRMTASNSTAGAQMGRFVSGAGDVNGDSHADIIAGAQDNAPDGDGVCRGAAYIYYGGVGGIVYEDVLLASDGAEGDLYGHGVYAAGDLDADGYDDVIVSAYGVDDSGDDAGAAYVYYGSTSGALRYSEEKLLAADGAAGHHFGQSAAGAGDIDGDGHGDILVAARYDDDAGTDAGSVYAYFGYADVDEDGVKAAEDCDDLSAAVGAPAARYVDADGDGFGTAESEEVCPDAEGYADADGDCDDSAAGTRPNAPDACGDGLDADCDGVGGPLGDEDGDGLSFSAEAALGSSDCDTDSDDDGLTDAEEVAHGTDATDPDTDGDGLLDGYEVHTAGSDPTTAEPDPQQDDPAPDTDDPADDSGTPADSGAGSPEPAESEGGLSAGAPAGCATSHGAPGGWAVLLLGLLITGRRRYSR